MATNPHLCCLKRIDPARNMARYYTLSVEPTLFGDAALVRQWGRIGTRGQFKINLFDTTGLRRQPSSACAKSRKSANIIPK
ncbi:WGR domain-containing protein [Nitratireductor aquimarinus]|uniref:WGR domain-containing protein n=1 Tax=Nitratireductor aquimarinus TaxID=889300 RepID=UPI001CD770E3|nr:WGR domain-containing protein [Nitratireductor aquimarinus]MCA1304938.1 WGR domain-containing protein [Nitratireductor aquimarinus]